MTTKLVWISQEDCTGRKLRSDLTHGYQVHVDRTHNQFQVVCGVIRKRCRGRIKKHNWSLIPLRHFPRLYTDKKREQLHGSRLWNNIKDCKGKNRARNEIWSEILVLSLIKSKMSKRNWQLRVGNMLDTTLPKIKYREYSGLQTSTGWQGSDTAKQVFCDYVDMSHQLIASASYSTDILSDERFISIHKDTTAPSTKHVINTQNCMPPWIVINVTHTA